jgi:hypothetical protein
MASIAVVFTWFMTVYISTSLFFEEEVLRTALEKTGLGRGFKSSHPVHYYQSGKLRHCFTFILDECRTKSLAMQYMAMSSYCVNMQEDT